MEYQFAWDGWALATGIFVLVFVVSSCAIAIEERGLHAQKGVSIVFFWAFVIGAGITLFATPFHRTSPRDATVADVVAAAGITNGMEYPLFLGDFKEDGGATASTQASLFSSTTVVELKPTDVVTIGYEHDDLWWQLNLPTDETSFRRAAEGEAASVTIWFNDSWGLNTHGREITDAAARWKNTPTSCKVVVRTIWPTRECEYPGETLIVDPWLDGVSLPNLVDRFFSHAVITLTPEQHAEMFKTN